MKICSEKAISPYGEIKAGVCRHNGYELGRLEGRGQGVRFTVGVGERECQGMFFGPHGRGAYRKSGIVLDDQCLQTGMQRIRAVRTGSP